MSEIKRFSFSDLRTFHECPYRLEQKKLKNYSEQDTEALLIGKYAHAMLESDKAAEKFLTKHYDSMFKFKKTKNEAIKSAYINIVSAVEQVKQLDIYKKVEASMNTKELKLVVNRGNYDISGILDVLKIDEENRLIEIIDWKTVADFETKYDEYFGARLEWYEKYLPQLALYAWFVKEQSKSYRNFEVTGRLVGFTKTSPINVQEVRFSLGKLSNIESNPYVSNVLREIDEMAAYYAENDKPERCYKCSCCAQNHQYKEIKI